MLVTRQLRRKLKVDRDKTGARVNLLVTWKHGNMGSTWKQNYKEHNKKIISA